VAPEVVRFLAAQVGVDAVLFAQYLWEGRTIEAHRAQIREMTKIRECHRTDEEGVPVASGQESTVGMSH